MRATFQGRSDLEALTLEKRARQAEVEVSRLKAELGPARERDLDAEANAIRSGGKVPDATNEPKVKAKLASAERDAAVMSRALQAAQTDHGAFLAKHRGELFADVAERRAQIARDAAEAAGTALQAYGRYEDLPVHPLTLAAANSSEAEWRDSGFAEMHVVGDEPIEDLSEK